MLTHKIKSNKRSNLEAILVQNYTLLAKRETPTGNLVLVISRENQFHFFLAQPQFLVHASKHKIDNKMLKGHFW